MNNYFSYIYVEQEAINHKNTIKILNKFKSSKVIIIERYKDIFSRGNNNFNIQKYSPNLILALKKENSIYKGSSVCENFGNEYFYYTSSVMNCIYDCEYCYLQGMYPSAHIVVFVNIEDIFKESEEILKKHEMYLCISYDTDLLALENILGFCREWIDFCNKHNNLKIELRTKSSNTIEYINSNVILAWTLSPQEIIDRFEHKTPSLLKRLNAVKKITDSGQKVRICIDPIIYLKDYKTIYKNFIKEIFDYLDKDKILDISIGVFRVSKDYLKKMRKERADSLVLNYPYIIKNGIATYENDFEMIDFVYDELGNFFEKSKIYK